MFRQPTPFLYFAVLLALAALACAQADGVLKPTEAPSPTAAADPTIIPRPTHTAEPITTPAAETLRCVVVVQALNVRTCAGTWCPAVDWLTLGEVITPTHTSGAWLQVPSGWIHSHYVRCEP